MDRVEVAVIGASGYTGAELLRLLSLHPRMRLAAVTSEKSAGLPVADVFPHLARFVSLAFEPLAPDAVAKRADAVFLALPHTKSFTPAAVCLEAGKKVVDLSADFRLHDPAAYERWYQTPHPHPDLLERAVYGLPELHRREIQQATLVASPGCYPTAAILGLAPLVSRGLVAPGSIIVDAKSGVSGAGRSPALASHFPEAHESIEAYKVGTHRHTAEIEQELTAVAAGAGAPGGLAARAGRGEPVQVTFTPHLVPMNRGILSTAYCRLTEPGDREGLRSLYRDFYKGEPFVRIHDGERSANPRHVRGSNFCDLAVFPDGRTGVVVVTAAIDNLVKGAAGQAIQAMNLMLGLPEDLGLASPGIDP